VAHANLDWSRAMSPAFNPLTLVLVLSVAGCGGASAQGGQEPAQAPTTAPSAEPRRIDPEPFAPPAAYAALFQPGWTATYEGVHSVSHWDDEDPAADESGMVHQQRTWTFTCAVAEITALPSGVVSRIECHGDDTDSLAGIYAATEHGVWALSRPPASAEDLAAMVSESALLVPARLEPVHESEEYEEGGMELVGETRDGAYCYRLSSWGGDESSRELCVAEGRGITLFRNDWAGGSVSETTITQVAAP
jgi:hypothetical protein